MEKANPLPGEAVEALRSALSALGLELCHLEWKPGRRGTLVLFIDRPGGVGLDDCEAASAAASSVLDPLEDRLPSYVLEVSSPGLDRPLWTPADCERFAGQRVDVKLRQPVEGTSRLKGLLEQAAGERLTILDEDRKRRYTIRFGDVKSARLVPEFGTSGRGRIEPVRNT
ncbi:MAG TPA: ribosome maturation factor RimP [Thermoanaerobaculia bacterium]|nr:ribosome maturation factor RimP [Thermoanaerobaculia bacterium]